jgi:UDP-2,3-diacylglucosamine pyrophosphatase LpxH
MIGQITAAILGMIAGLLSVAVLWVLYTVFAGPLQEWLVENTLDRWKRQALKGPDAESGCWAAVISDVHLDTWQDGLRTAEMVSFLRALRLHPGVRYLYVNGDIVDTPPHPKNVCDPGTIDVDATKGVDSGSHGWWAEGHRMIGQALAEACRRDDTETPLELLISVGNHDIGLAGLRYAAPQGPLAARAVWMPGFRHAGQDHAVLVRHGHSYDPFLWVYLRLSILELVRGPLIRGKSRRSVGKNADAKQATAPPRRGCEPNRLCDPELVGPVRESFLTKVVRYRFRHAARRDMILLKMRRAPVQGITIGHTHVPDRYEFPGLGVYVNTGDWAGDTKHASYAFIGPSGYLYGPYQWADDDQSWLPG